MAEGRSHGAPWTTGGAGAGDEEAEDVDDEAARESAAEVVAASGVAAETKGSPDDPGETAAVAAEAAAVGVADSAGVAVEWADSVEGATGGAADDGDVEGARGGDGAAA